MEQRTVKGRVKYSKTSCYLCSEWLDDNDVEEHLLHCRQQVKECPNRCGAIVISALLELHLNTCIASYGELETKSIFNTNTMSSEENSDGLLSCMDIIEGLEKSNRDMKLSQADCYFQLNRLQARIDRVVQGSMPSHGPAILSCQTALAAMYQQQSQHIESLVKVKEQLMLGNVLPGSSSSSGSGIQAANVPNSDVKPSGSETPKVMGQNAGVPNSGNEPSGTETLGGNVANAGVAKSEQNPVRQEAEQPSTSKMVGAAVNTLEPPQEERIKILEQKVVRYRQETLYTKQRIDDLQKHLMTIDYKNSLASTNGHLIWRLSSFAKRMAEAQESGMFIRSPFFSNAQYGYLLQVELWLDGFDSWRGRNMIARVMVQQGRYDALLKWPNKLNVSFILYDQAKLRETAKNIHKFFSIQAQKTSGMSPQLVHIPHQVLFTGQYVQDDSIIMAIDVKQGDGSSKQ